MAVLRERDAYLSRLGLEAEPPSVDFLFRIHRAHVERVPYETLWIHLGEILSIDPAESGTRIATLGRGGYCFHLNGGLSELLRSLGFVVTRHVGGVHGPDGPTDEAMTNHLVLMVSGLPTDGNPAGSWYVDVGLGDAMYEPLPLVAGAFTQGPFTLSLEMSPRGVGDWHLTHDPAGSFAGMAWQASPGTMEQFDDSHRWMTTAPESRFRTLLTMQRREAKAVDVLRGLWLRRIGEGATESTIDTKPELMEVLGDVFRIDVGALDRAAVDAMWTSVRAAHEAWEEAGRP